MPSYDTSIWVNISMENRQTQKNFQKNILQNFFEIHQNWSKINKLHRAKKLADLGNNYVQGGQGSHVNDSNTYLELRPLK